MREVFFSQEAKNSSTMLARYGKCRRRDGVSILGDRSLYRCQVIPFCIKTRSFVSKPSNIDDSGNARRIVERLRGFSISTRHAYFCRRVDVAAVGARKIEHIIGLASFIARDASVVQF